MLEVELKARITREQKEFIPSKLEKFLQKKENVTYEDEYYDTIDKKLENSDSELRIRIISGSEQKIVLTYKDPPFHAESKSKPEIETEVMNKDNMDIILKKIGFISYFKYNKECNNYVIKFNEFDVLVTLVNIPEIDSDLRFIEVETQVYDKNKIYPAMKNLMNLLEYLQITKNSITSEYYVDMVRKTRNHHGRI